ncbi:MAG: hypothetical protein CBB97_10525 [Candidatus Endolissoclinum sp. TMED37]|nr:MAG: hypothetical protein CBB97_10525 [Candidatus Endolissoclinum sp. TMED37]|tara:strand:- start:51 stop:1031 length:981 start_codon:yes stop_codon:yes gene_type:complete
MKKIPPHRDIMIHEARWGYKFQPNINARIMHDGGGFLIETNEDGFRCSRQLNKDTENKKILIFGDSYTAGDGVSNSARFSNKLNDRLKNFDIYNFGLSGSGTDQQLIIFDNFREKINHDLVLVVVQVENIKRNVLRKRVWTDRYGRKINVPKPWYELGKNLSLNLKGVPVPKPNLPGETQEDGGYLNRLTDWLNKKQPKFKKLLQKIFKFQPLPEYNSEQSAEWKLLKRILIEFKSKSKKPIYFIVYPTYQYIDSTASYNKIRKRFENLSKEHDIKCLHLIDCFHKLSKEKRSTLWFQNDHHPTRLAHEITSEAIKLFLDNEKFNA